MMPAGKYEDRHAEATGTPYYRIDASSWRAGTFAWLPVFAGSYLYRSYTADTNTQVAKVVYEQIAKGGMVFSASTVERAVRHAIETAWGRGDMDTLDQIFGYTVQASKGRPTNTEYIAAVADYLKLTERV